MISNSFLNHAVVAISISVLFGCDKPIEDPAAFAKACETRESGFVHSKESQPGIKYTLAYRPADYFRARETAYMMSGAGSTTGIESISLDSSFYFALRVETSGAFQRVGPIFDLENRLLALQKESGGISKRILLVTKRGDTIPCALAQVQAEGVSHNAVTVSVVFGKRHGAMKLENLKRILFLEFGPNTDQIEFALDSFRPKIRFAPKQASSNA